MTDNSFDFRNPQYAPLIKARMRRLQRIREQPELIGHLKRVYRDQPWLLINDFGVTFDPRNVDRGLPAAIPFVLFPKQVEWCKWLVERWKAREPGITDKSRDLGMSWCAVSMAVALAVTHDGFTAGFGSRKEEYVDKSGSPKTLFWKARKFIECLPPEFRAGHIPNVHSPFMRLSFPETGSTITGEAGDNIGRGDRASIYIVDEAQPLTARILTPSGWSTMGAMRRGSKIIGPDGKPRRVTHINDAGEHDVYRVTLQDGTTIESSPNHLWAVDRVWGRKERQTLRTHEIAEKFKYESPGGQTQYLYRLPIVAPVEYAPQPPLPLDPYIVGVLLGDGSIAGVSPRLTTADEEILSTVRAALPDGCVVGAFDGRYSYGLVDAAGKKSKGAPASGPRSRMWKAIDAAGLDRVTAPFKRVPAKYMLASVEDRLSVLQGLMDTDGYAAPNGTASFYTSSAQMAQDVRELVQSLGGVAFSKIRSDKRGYRDQHCVQVVLPEGFCPFRLARKKSRMKPRSNKIVRTIVNVEKIGRAPVRCITVDAPDGLYVTDHFIVTHNSAYLERPQLIEASLSATTNCRIDISSANGMGNPFAQKRHSWPAERIFTLHWRDDPRKDDEWYAKQCEQLDPVTVAQEIDINYSASVEGVIIPSAWVQAAIGAHETLGIAPSGERRAALDVADEGADKNAFASAHGILLDRLDEWSGQGSDIFQTVTKAFAFADDLGIDSFIYDADGMGAGVRGDARVINEARIEDARRNSKPPATIGVSPFWGSGAVERPNNKIAPGADRTNGDYYANLKAQSWGALRARFRETFRAITEPGYKYDPAMLISLDRNLPLLTRLTSELSQPTWGPNTIGKMVVNKKPDGAKSPNLADAVMMVYGAARRSMVIDPEAVRRSAWK